jgi:hypothetical protein
MQPAGCPPQAGRLAGVEGDRLAERDGDLGIVAGGGGLGRAEVEHNRHTLQPG